MQIEDVRNIILSYPHVVEKCTETNCFSYDFKNIPFATIQVQPDETYVGFSIKDNELLPNTMEYASIKRDKRRRRHNTHIALSDCHPTLLKELVTEAYHQATVRCPRIYQPAYAATIGCFDGVHKGHKYLFEHLKKIGQERGLRTMAITFDPSPLSILQPTKLHQEITSTLEKEQLIYDLGIDEVYILRLNTEKLSMSALDFMRNILKRQLNIQSLLLGHDHTFGSDRPASRNIFNMYGKQLKMEITHCTPYIENGIRISSSGMKQALREGNIATANEGLGHSYHFSGLVTSGLQLGRRLGFPTANLIVSPKKLLPQNGVYAVKVTHKGQPYNGILNIGIRPTIGTEQQSVEVHLFNFKGDLYGEQLQVDVCARLRDEQRFDSLDDLQKQIQDDKKKALSLFTQSF